MRWDPQTSLNYDTAYECRRILRMYARKYSVPQVYITAHFRSPAADEARKEVMRAMIRDLGMRRYLVAKIFGRHHRRVRKSVLGV